MEIVALAAGVSLTEVETLFAADKQVLKKKIVGAPRVNMRRMSEVAPQSPEIKALKLMLNPTVQSYRSEYGRTPATTHALDRKTGILSCGTLMRSGDCGQENCGSQNCGEHNCGQHSCEGTFSCGSNNSRTATCNKFLGSLTSPQVLERFKSDPFLQQCFKEFNVRTTLELSTQLKALIHSAPRP